MSDVFLVQTPEKAYYEALKGAVFRSAQKTKPVLAGKSTATFVLNRVFTRFTGFLAYDFLVEIHQQFGRELIPFAIKSGCVHISTVFEDHMDDHRVDFRTRIVEEPVYHDIFRRYNCDRILTTFPNAAEPSRIDNRRFAIDSDGRPKPY